MSDTPRTDKASFVLNVSGSPSDEGTELAIADFARTLERELNEAKKSPWKPLSEMPEALKDGREVLIRSSNTEIFSCHMLMGYFSIRDFPWLDLSTGNDYRLDDSQTEYMEIPE